MKPVDPETTATDKRVSRSQLPGAGATPGSTRAVGGRGSGGGSGGRSLYCGLSRRHG